MNRLDELHALLAQALADRDQEAAGLPRIHLDRHPFSRRHYLADVAWALAPISAWAAGLTDGAWSCPRHLNDDPTAQLCDRRDPHQVGHTFACGIHIKTTEASER